MNKKVQGRKSILVPAFVEGFMLIRVKKNRALALKLWMELDPEA